MTAELDQMHRPGHHLLWMYKWPDSSETAVPPFLSRLDGLLLFNIHPSGLCRTAMDCQKRSPSTLGDMVRDAKVISTRVSESLGLIVSNPVNKEGLQTDCVKPTDPFTLWLSNICSCSLNCSVAANV